MTKNKNVLAIPRTLGTITSTSWTAPADMTFDQWKRAGFALAGVRSMSIWALTDWWVYGQHHYGDRVKALREFEISDLKPETLMDYGTVARRIEPRFRIEVLSFTHHRLVAKHSTNAEVQRQWLERAAVEHWTVRQLFDAINQSCLSSATQNSASTDESDLGAPITINNGNGRDADANEQDDAGANDHAGDEHRDGPEREQLLPPRKPMTMEEKLLLTFYEHAGALVVLAKRPTKIFVNTDIPPSQLRLVAQFLYKVANEIEGHPPDHEQRDEEHAHQ